MSRLAAAGAALFLVALAGEAATNWATTSAVRQIFADRPGWHVGRIEATPFGRSLTLHDIDIEVGGVRVAVAKFDLRGPTLRSLASSLLAPIAEAATPLPPPRPDTQNMGPQTSPPPPAVPGNASAENIVVTGQGMTYRIKRIDLSNSLLTSSDVAALFDPKSTEPISDRLKKLSASTITIPEIVGDGIAPGVEQHWLQKQVVFSTVVAGKAATASSGPLTFASKDISKDTGGSIGGRVTALQMTNVDLAQIAHVFASIRVNDSEPVLPLFDQLTASGVEVTDSRIDGVLAVESMTERGVRARAPRARMPVTASPAGPADVAARNALIDDALHSVETDLVELTNVSLPITDQDGAGKIAIAKIFVRGLANSRVGDSGFRDLTYAGTNGKVTVGSFGLGGFPLPATTGSDAKGAPVFAVPMIDRMTIDDIDCDLSVKDSKLAEATTTQVKFKLAHVGFSGDGFAPNTIPSTSRGQLDHLTFDVTPRTDAIKVFSAMGYSHLDVSSAMTTAYNEAKQELAIKPLSLSGEGMGRLDLALDLGKVGKNVMSTDRQTALEAAQSIVANRIDLKLTNDGLFERALDMKAKMDNLMVDDERRNGIDFFSNQLPEMANDHPAAKRLGEAVAKFIAEPKSLHVTITSKRGLGMGDAALVLSPDVLLDSLDVTASAND